MKFSKNDSKTYIKIPEPLDLNAALLELEALPDKSVYSPNFISFINEQGDILQFIKFKPDRLLLDIPDYNLSKKVNFESAQEATRRFFSEKESLKEIAESYNQDQKYKKLKKKSDSYDKFMRLSALVIIFTIGFFSILSIGTNSFSDYFKISIFTFVCFTTFLVLPSIYFTVFRPRNLEGLALKMNVEYTKLQYGPHGMKKNVLEGVYSSNKILIYDTDLIGAFFSGEEGGIGTVVRVGKKRSVKANLLTGGFYSTKKIEDTVNKILNNEEVAAFSYMGSGTLGYLKFGFHLIVGAAIIYFYFLLIVKLINFYL